MIVNNQMERGYLFTLELRVCRQIAKLNVYEEDSLTDLIARLSTTVTYKQKYAERLKEKLEAEFKKLVSTQDCSAKVREKLQSLTEESKLIIVGISETEKNDPADETPFKILLENSANFRKRSVEQPKRHFQYEQESPNLIKKYDQDPVCSYDERQNLPKARSYLLQCNKSNQYESSTLAFNYDIPNANSRPTHLEEKKSLQNYSPIANINSKRSINHNENYEPRTYNVAEIIERRKEGCIRKHNQPTNYQQIRKESFQDYKIQKIKSLSSLGAVQQIRPRFEPTLQDTYSTLGQTKLVYNQNQEDLKIDYSSKYLDRRGVRQRGGKKFSYLSQQNF